jgi:peptidoglycan-N-acetylglucosamine deacetylase
MALYNQIHRLANTLGNRFLSPPIGGGFRQFVNHGPRDVRRLALTFDDGPNRGSTELLLDVMRELNVPGTFFCVGENVRTSPDIVQRLDREGHVVGCHSDRHERSGSLHLKDTGQIDRVEQSITSVLGRRPLMYRPPWGWLTPWEGRRLHARGYTIVGWDVYTLDWKIPEVPVSTVSEAILKQCKNGSILLLHDGYPLADHYDKQVTAQTVRSVVPVLRDLGYEFVTVPELLGTPAYAAAPVAAPASAAS